MLIVAGSITTRDDGREQFLAAVRPKVSAKLAEPGRRPGKKDTISTVATVR